MDEILIKTMFQQIEKIIRKDSNYVPRNYKTVGGMWTVDTYKKGDITLQIMDEGWTSKIFSDKISAIDSGGHFKIEKGTLEDFDSVYKSII
jgi:hypothetical protein